MKCERCGNDTHFLAECNYCKKKLCRNCEKASDTTKNGERKIICKDCWGNMESRTQYKTKK